MPRLTTSAAAAALLLAMAGAAIAAPATPARKSTAPVATQAATPAQPALPPIAHGPPVPNVCVYADERAVGVSSVGKAAATRMQQLSAQVNAELQGEQSVLQNDISAFKAKASTLTPEQQNTQGQPLQQRIQAFDAKAALRQRELEATRREALDQIHQKIDGILRTVYQQRGCSMLLRGESLYVYNPAMDVTEAVVAQLNVAMPTITFDRKTLPAQGQQ